MLHSGTASWQSQLIFCTDALNFATECKMFIKQMCSYGIEMGLRSGDILLVARVTVLCLMLGQCLLVHRVSCRFLLCHWEVCERCWDERLILYWDPDKQWDAESWNWVWSGHKSCWWRIKRSGCFLHYFGLFLLLSLTQAESLHQIFTWVLSVNLHPYRPAKTCGWVKSWAGTSAVAMLDTCGYCELVDRSTLLFRFIGNLNV